MRIQRYLDFVTVAWLGGGIAAALVGCHEPPRAATVATNVVAMVGASPITADALQSELTRRRAGAPGHPVEVRLRERVLDDLIQTEALYQKALAAGYAQDPQIVAALRNALVTKYREDQLAKLPPVQLSDAELTNYHQQHPERFGAPETFRAAVIEMRLPRPASPEKRAEAVARANAVRQAALGAAETEATFGPLAQQYSEDQATRYRGGDLGWLPVGSTNAGWPPELLQAIARLNQPRTISPVIETPTALYLVKLAERKPATLRPFATVRDGVVFHLTREREQQREQQISACATQGLAVQINQARLEQIALPEQPAAPPTFPGGVVETQPRRSP